MFLISLLFFTSFSVFSTHNNTVSGVSGSSCTSSDTFRLTWYGGTPSSIASTLTANGASALAVSKLEYWPMSPGPGPTGALLYNESLVDWVKSNANFTQWTVNIKPGLKWSNGQNVTSADILATYSKTFALSPSLDFTGSYKEVTSVVPLNSSAVQFNLNASDAYFLDIVGSTLTNVLPAADANVNYTGFGSTNVVIGPFYAVNYVEGQTQMVLDRNPYFNTTGLPEPKICQVDLNFEESTTLDSQVLASGSTDLTEVDPTTISSLLSSNHNLGIIQEPGDFAEVATWNVTAYPFNMTNFRQAIVYAVNESASVAEGLAGYGSTAYNSQGGTPAFITSLYDPNQKIYSYNPNDSISLLQSIGINKGSDGHLQYNNGTDISLTIWANSQNPQDLTTGKVMQTDLQNIGFKVSVVSVGRNAISSLTSMAAATMYVISSGGVDFPDAYFDAQPGWINAIDHPAIPSTYWEYPPSANNEYFSNLTAFTASSNLSQTQQYLNNIQVINAQYLPAFIVNYESVVFGYNTQYWTNWGTYPSNWVIVPGLVDAQLFAELQPTTGVTTSTTTTPVSVTSTQSTTTSTSTSLPVTSTQSTTTSTTSSTTPVTTSSNTILIAAIVVVIIVVIVGALLFLRRRKP
jgi:ABC-type transport system substrate-binding protein